MRSIINISLPKELHSYVKKEVKNGHFATTSEFFRTLLKMWNEEKLLKEIKQSQQDVKDGNFVTLNSLKDLR